MDAGTVGVEPLADLAALHPRVLALWWVVVPVTLAALVIDLALAPLGLRGLLTGLVVLVASGLTAGIPVLPCATGADATRCACGTCGSATTIWVILSVILNQRLQFIDTRQGPWFDAPRSCRSHAWRA